MGVALAHLASDPDAVAFPISPLFSSSAKGGKRCVLGEACPRVVPTEPPPRGHRSASRPTAHFHSERHAASRLYEMEPHNQIEKPQCRTVQMKETLQLNPTSPPTTTKSNRNSPALEQLCSTPGSYLHTSGIIRFKKKGRGWGLHTRECFAARSPQLQVQMI